MELGIYAVVAVVIIVAVAAFSRRLGVTTPIILVLVGIGLSYLPLAPSFSIPQDWVLDGLLPPILYAAAITIPFVDFRHNIGTITGLSVVLVVVTAFGAGLLLFSLLPDLSLAAAIAFGAIISPPDAVAATSIGRRLGLPPRILTVLEGEGLVNDATALVLLRSALAAAAAGGAFNIWHATGDFAYGVVVAIGIGLAVGVLTVEIRKRLTDPILDTAISIVVPFIAFIPTNLAGASGVLAVVVAGLYTGHAAPGALSAQARINWRINWHTIQFLLENGVFLFIGLQLRVLVEDVTSESGWIGVGEAIGLGLVAIVALIVVRVIWMSVLVTVLKIRERARSNHTRLSRTLPGKAPTPVTAQDQSPLGWRGGVLLSWAGMRGVVTLAAAQSLPEDMPYRSELILIAYTVAVVTLVVQGSTLPALIRALKFPGTDLDQRRRELAQLLDEVNEAGLSVLDDPEAIIETDAPIDEDLVEQVRQASLIRTESLWEHTRRAEPVTGAPTPHQIYQQLRLAVVLAERAQLLDARARRAYPSRVLAQVQTLLDLEESQLRRPA